MQKLPISDFRWGDTLSREEILQFNVDGEYGCFVEVDIKIPVNLHDKFNDYPIIPAPLDITQDIASPTSLNIRQKRNGKAQNFSCKKLAPNLFPQYGYKCHIRNLKFYLEQGAELIAVHRVLCFKQVVKCYNYNTSIFY